MNSPTDRAVEAAAREIDPEAFGLAPPDRSTEPGGYLTDRDEARARAKAAIIAYLEASMEPSEEILKAGLLGEIVTNEAHYKFVRECTSGSFKAMRTAELHALKEG